MFVRWKSRNSIFVLAIFAAAVLALPFANSSALTEEKAEIERLRRHYVQGMELIREHSPVEMNYEVLTRSAIYGMLRTLDPHSNFYDRKAFEETRNDQRSQYYGIGASIQQRYGGVYIMEPFKDTPAARAGLRYGDLIVGVDKDDATKWNSDEVRNHLRGELGTEVTVKVKRAGIEAPVSITLERGAVDLPSISGVYMIKPGIGYIALSRGFHSTTADELSAALGSLKEQGMQQLVFDLRGNGGGFLDQAIRVCDKFLQRGQAVVSVREREGRASERSRDYKAESGSPEVLPLVVLIDEGTASASEIVAGAMQDHDRGLIIGENSFGKGLVQTIINLPEGCGLTLTTARYYTPSGRLIQRDYSNGSIYEYHFKREAAGNKPADKVSPAVKPQREQRKTDSGRVVYGGGGIEPDVKVDSPVTTNLQFRVWVTGLFMFTRDLLGGRIKGFESYKRAAGVEFEYQPKGNEFAVSDELMAQYKLYMADFAARMADAGITMPVVEANMEFSRGKIREELLTATYGQDMARRILILNDPQIQRALAELPNAAQLAERARRLTKSASK